MAFNFTDAAADEDEEDEDEVVEDIGGYRLALPIKPLFSLVVFIFIVFWKGRVLPSATSEDSMEPAVADCFGTNVWKEDKRLLGLLLGALTEVSATAFGAGCTVTASILEAASRILLDDELCIVSLSEERRVEEHEEEEEEEEEVL